jgi:hypothetical protein
MSMACNSLINVRPWVWLLTACVERMNKSIGSVKYLSFFGRCPYITFEWLLSDVNSIKLITLEKSTDGILFLPETTISGNNAVSGKFIKTVPADAHYKYYRLLVVSNDGRKIYSNVISTSPSYTALKTVWPNPAQNKLNLELYALQKEMSDYKVTGSIMQK